MGILLNAIPEKYFMGVAFFIQGLCWGIFTVIVPKYLTELLPAERRYVVGASYTTAKVLGFLVSAGISILINLTVKEGNELYLFWVMIGCRLLFVCIQMLLLALVYKEEVPAYYYLRYIKRLNGLKGSKVQ